MNVVEKDSQGKDVIVASVNKNKTEGLFWKRWKKCRRQRQRSAEKICISELHHKYQILYHSGTRDVVLIVAFRAQATEKMNSRRKFFYPAIYRMKVNSTKNVYTIEA